MVKIITSVGPEFDRVNKIVEGLWRSSDIRKTLEAVELLNSHAPHKLATILMECFMLVESETEKRSSK